MVTFLTVDVLQIIQAYLRRLLADYVRKIILMRVGVVVQSLPLSPQHFACASLLPHLIAAAEHF